MFKSLINNVCNTFHQPRVVQPKIFHLSSGTKLQGFPASLLHSDNYKVSVEIKAIAIMKITANDNADIEAKNKI